MKPSLVFFGTGPVSLATLEGLHADFTFEAIITKPTKTDPSGRVIHHPVKNWADEHHISVFQPATKQEIADVFANEKFHSPLGLVVDYGLIIPQSVIDVFELGIANSHFSLLPQWRGADPITFAILSGQEQTGVSIMLIVPALDEGPLLTTVPLEIDDTMTTPKLTSQLVALSNQTLKYTLRQYLDGTLEPYPQDPAKKPSYSRRLTKADGRIDWTKPAAQIEREIRAYLGWPGSAAHIGGKDVTITAAHVLENQGSLELSTLDDAKSEGRRAKDAPGTPFKHHKDLAVVCGDGVLVIDTLKPAGKREMTGRAFVAGNAL